MRGRKEIELTEEEVVEAIKNNKYLKDAANSCGVSYPTFLKWKQHYGLDPKKIEVTERLKEFESVTWTEEEFIEEMSKIDDGKQKTIGYNYFKFKFEEDIILVPLGDLHLGAETTEHELISKIVSKIGSLSNVKVILCGDYIDNFNKYAPGGGIYGQSLSTTRQKEIAEWICRFLGDKVLGVIQGCHEEWSFNHDGFDFGKYLANKSGSVYLGKRAIIDVELPKVTYKIYVDHNSRWWSNDNNCHGLLKTCRQQFDFDLGIGAHRHVPSSANHLIRGKMVKACKISSFKRPDRFIEKIKSPHAPILTQCYVLLNENYEHRTLGIIYFEDLDHALRFL